MLRSRPSVMTKGISTQQWLLLVRQGFTITEWFETMVEQKGNEETN